jgi:hypothetical protein
MLGARRLPFGCRADSNAVADKPFATFAKAIDGIALRFRHKVSYCNAPELRTTTLALDRS